MNYPFLNQYLNSSQTSLNDSHIKVSQSSQQLSFDEFEQKKENIQPDINNNLPSELDKKINTEQIHIFESIFKSDQFKLNEFNSESLLKLLHIIETYNRFIGLYMRINEIDFNKLVDSLINETDYYKSVLQILIQILLKEVFNDCLIYNVALLDLNLIKDELCLNELSILIYKMIKEKPNDSREKSSLLLKQTDISASCLSIENKIDLISLFVETIITDGQTYRSNIDLLNKEIENIELKLNELKTEINYNETRKFYLLHPPLSDVYHKQKTEYKIYEEKLREKMLVLKNYSRLSYITRIKFNKFCFIYFWRFKAFAKSLFLERRFMNNESSSEWFQIESIEMMSQVLTCLKNLNNSNESFKNLEIIINEIKSNDEKMKLNDFKFDHKLTELDETNEPIIRSILESTDVFNEVELLLNNLVFASLVNVDFEFGKKHSLENFKLDSIFDSIEWSTHPNDLKSLKTKVVEAFDSVNTKYLSHKFAVDLSQSWVNWCLKCESSSELRFAIYFLIKNIKWDQSMGKQECQICYRKENFQTIDQDYKKFIKNQCHNCNKHYHLKCVVESIEFDFFKSDSCHVLCTQCNEQEKLKELEELKKIEKKIEDESKLNSYEVNSRTLRANARMNRLPDVDEYDDSPVKRFSRRKRVFIEEDDDDNDDSFKSRSFNKQRSEDVINKLRPRKKVNYSYDHNVNIDDNVYS